MELIIDSNEHTNKKLVKELEKYGFFLIPERLDVGDFFIPPYIIERKEFSDFISSSKNHGGLRVMEQLKKMSEYTKDGYICVLLIEGSESEAVNKKSQRTGISHAAAFNQIQGLKISVAVDYKLPIIHSDNMGATAYILKRISEKATKKSKKAIPVRSSVPASRPTKEKVRYQLEGLPYIGPKTADHIMSAYTDLFSFYLECVGDPNKVKNRIKRINKKIPEQVQEILTHRLKEK
jgi:ERCC4-type nuclease